MTVAEVSRFLGLHQNTIYRFAKKGAIPYTRINGRLRFRKELIDAWLDERSHKPFLIETLLSQVEFSLDGHDRIHLRRRTEMKSHTAYRYDVGSVIERKTKNREVRFYIDFQYDGQCVREVVKGARRRVEAVKALYSRVSDALRGKYNLPKEKPKLTLNEMADLYLEKYSKPNKKSWKTSDMVSLRVLKPFFGSHKLSEITPLMIEEYRSKRLSDGLKKCSVNREVSCLRKIFNVAINWGYASENPVRKIKFFSEKENLRERVLGEDEEVRLFEVCSISLKPILLVALHTGMRKREIFRMKWADVDLTKREIRIPESKSGRMRTLPINSILYYALYQLRQANGSHEHVFPNPDTGKPYTDVKRSFRSACKRAGIKNLRFHDLRHTFASRLVRKGVDLVIIKELMGHASIVTTQRYLHSQAKEKKAAVETLAAQPQKVEVPCQKSVNFGLIDVRRGDVIRSFSIN
jgi:excisionase family DNA binding protein